MEPCQTPVDLERFTPDFFGVTYEPEEDENDDRVYDRFDALETMQSAIPEDAVSLGQFEDEVENWTTWEVDDYYYVMPWESDDFDWALFRISWDDNWGRFEWESCARVAGYPKAPTDAAKVMLEATFKSWMLDLGDGSSYRAFIEGL